MADKSVQDELADNQKRTNELLQSIAESQGEHTDDAPQNDPKHIEETRKRLDEQAKELAQAAEADTSEEPKKSASKTAESKK